MDIFIYSYSSPITSRNVIEDRLEDLLGDQGEVTGGGAGNSGSNIDIEVYQRDAHTLVGPIRKLLKEAKVPMDTVIVVEGKKFRVYQ